MRNIHFVLLLLISFNTCFCQGEFEKLIMKSGNSTYSIHQKRIHSFQITETKKDDSSNIFTITTIGDLISATASEVRMLPTQFNTKKIGKDSVVYNITKQYPKHSSSISIKSSDISHIAIQSESAYNRQVVGVFITILGSITALIAAPLVSIDYKNGQINSNTYYKVAATGLGCVVVGLPLVWSSYERKFNFKPSKGSKGKVWKIEN